MQSPRQHLTLRSKLAELARVHPWVQALAARYNLPERTTFAIDLCLEEALSNIIRHGYSGDPNQQIEIDFRTSGERAVLFVIDDTAPHFQPVNPAAPLEASKPLPLQETIPGGNGIPLMRKFADAVDWEPLEIGNRLTLRFSPR